MQCNSITFSGHALQRMFARGIKTEDVKSALSECETVADYPYDRPYPSRLVLAWANEKPLHIVVAQSAEDYACYVITAYIPTTKLWHDDFKTRRSL
ncbi:MAG: hypothetical protein C9356_19430 [Oleiphilus sp.]|nr:MAG: hypothetical protein C9356_19430 [Oleiphilus sp.]